jgi:protein TonB
VADPSAANRAHTTAAAAPSTAPDLPRIDVPSIVLPRLPEIPLGERAFDTLAFERRRFSGDPTRGPVVAGPEAPFDWRMVDRQVEPRVANPVPRYPTALISAGVEGSVTIRFVVDTFGVVERGSAVAVRSSHPLFEQAVRDVLRLMRFVPAEAGGRKVRQLVEQSFQFEIRR